MEVTPSLLFQSSLAASGNNLPQRCVSSQSARPYALYRISRSAYPGRRSELQALLMPSNLVYLFSVFPSNPPTTRNQDYSSSPLPAGERRFKALEKDSFSSCMVIFESFSLFRESMKEACKKLFSARKKLSSALKKLSTLIISLRIALSSSVFLSSLVFLSFQLSLQEKESLKEKTAKI